MPPYFEVTLFVSSDDQDQVITLLEAEGFDSFWQEDTTLKAYTNVHNQQEIQNLIQSLGLNLKAVSVLEEQNWNQAWEENYPSISVGTFCHIYPHFRSPEAGFKYYLKITPQMSFGTGHHETTRLMIRLMEEMNFTDKTVLDMGCGTGILGILAHQLGAKYLTWIDIDPQCAENCAENLLQNHIFEGRILTGGKEIIPDERFNVIIANIQRNVLLEDGAEYASKQEKGDEILLSGFFDFDSSNIISYFNSLNYTLAQQLEETNWNALRMIKS